MFVLVYTAHWLARSFFFARNKRRCLLNCFLILKEYLRKYFFILDLRTKRRCNYFFVYVFNEKRVFQIGFFIFDAKKFTNCFFIFCFYIVFIFYIVIKFIIEFYFEANDFYSFCESNFYSLIIIFSRDIFIKDIFQSKKFL